MSRAEWDNTLKEELGISVLPGESREPKKRTTRADLEKKERRKKSRVWTAYSGVDQLQRKIESRLEKLECTNYGDAVLEGDKGDDEEEANSGDDFGNRSEDEESSSDDDDFDDDDEDDEDGNPSRKRKRKKKKKKRDKKAKGKLSAKRKREKAAAAKRSKLNAKRPKKKRLKPLCEILLDENARKLSSVNSLEELDMPDYFNAKAPPSNYPPRRFCAVTNTLAKYKDTESNLPFANSKAYDQLKEQPPAWVKASIVVPFHEAMRSIEVERARRRQAL